MMGKETKKILRTSFQIVFLLALIPFLAWQFMERGDPPVFDRGNWTQRDGFAAISYGALTRTERPGLNSRDQFARHLRALKAAGYNWITTEDIINFYEDNHPLPEKALYLMLEGGRKDSVIFGQNIIGPVGAHATLFTYTETLGSWDNFFVTSSNVASLAKSKFWDVGSQGYRLLRINENMPGVEPGYFLSDFLRDQSGKRIETDIQAFERIADYYKKSHQLLESPMGWPPLAFIFMPANSLNVYMPPELEVANRNLMERYFKTAFTREGSAYNSPADHVFHLSRMQVQPHWDEQTLLKALENWSFRRNGFEVSSADDAGEWSTFRTTVEVDGEDIILFPEEGFIDPAHLRGSARWDNVNLSVTFKERDNQAERYIYLRYASRESYLRLTLRANRLQVHERLPGVGLIPIYDDVLPVSEPWEFDIQLKGNRLRMNLNSNFTLAFLPVSEMVRRGSVALGAPPLAYHQAVFSRVKAEFLPPAWQYEEPGGPPEDRPGEAVTARVLPLPQDRDGLDGLVRRLLQTGAEGTMAVAGLPEGRLDFDPEELVIPPFDREQSLNLWGGVAIQPRADADWQEVRRAVKGIIDNQYYAVVRLSREAALALAASGLSLDADYLMLDFARQDMSQKDWIALAHRHNRNNFLYASPGARNSGSRLYAPGSG